MSRNIDELWYGRVDPANDIGDNNIEIKQIENLMQRNFQILHEILDESEKERFEKYVDCVKEYLMLTNKQAFSDGLCFGMKLAARTLIDTDNNGY